MKATFVFLCATILCVTAHHLPEPEKQKLKEIHDACQSSPDTHVDENLLKKLTKNVDNKKVGDHLLCMAVKTGLMTKDGDLISDVIREKIDIGAHDRSNIDEVVKKCVVKYETPEKTAVQLLVCLVKNDVHYYHEL